MIRFRHRGKSSYQTLIQCSRCRWTCTASEASLSATFYGLPRPTGDIDYYSAVPANLNLIEMAGEDSALAKKYVAPRRRYESARGLHDKVD